MRMYGSVVNRMSEDRKFCDEIKVGTGMTEYLWSDRHAYEVVAVRDQKHVSVREYDHVHTGEAFENKWELVSNPDRPVYDLEKRGDYWYWVTTVTAEFLDGLTDDEAGFERRLWLATNGFDIDKIRATGKQIKRRRAKVSFGVASYYYDYEF